MGAIKLTRTRTPFYRERGGEANQLAFQFLALSSTSGPCGDTF